MQGHTDIIQARLQGVAPRSVWMDENKPQWLGEVQYEPNDSPASADLRFVVGLTVNVLGPDAATVEAWGKACELAGAARVITVVVRYDEPGRRGDVVDLRDTHGRMMLEVA